MIENQNRLDELLEKYSRSEINEPEFNELCNLINDPKNDNALIELLEQGLMKSSFAEMDKGQLNSMLAKITSSTAPLHKERGARVFRLWKRVAAAAAVVVMISVGGYFIFKNQKNQDIAKTAPQENKFKNDVAAPTKAKATITLSDGRVVALDSITNGMLATQGNVNVIKTADGKIVYNGSSTEVVYNTLTNPRGSLVIDMTLADGSHVWLNAGSSVTYPVAFVGNERKVAITGEAYFEVAHLTLNPSPEGEGRKGSIPFLVEANGTITEVLGTHFNVNSYSDEANVKITLLEGSVKVTKGNSSGLLKPGQQAILRQAQDDNELKVINGVDLDEVMAWKNGRFYFNGADIQTIMRQVARWYDVEVVYEGAIPTGHYNGKPSRDLTASEMLKLVEYSGVKVRIEGRKIIVLK